MRYRVAQRRAAQRHGLTQVLGLKFDPMKVYPPFLPCLWYALKTFGIIYIVLFGFFTVTRLLRHEPVSGSLSADFWLLPVFLTAIPTLLALVVYLGARVWAWSFDQYGLKGRTYWGRRVAIRWADVGDIKATSVEGIPALLIASRSNKSELFAYTLGVDLREIHIQLARRAGPDHMLTQCFRASAA